VFTRANHHGMGNRLNSVIGAFALALVTNRGLAIEWEASSNCKGKHVTTNLGVTDKDCDPVGLKDLYELPFVTAAHLHNMSCTQKHQWLVHGDRDSKKFDAMLRNPDLARVYEEQQVICAESDRHFGWAVTCNQKDLFPDPWNAYGLLQDYLLQRPVKSIRHKLLTAKITENNNNATTLVDDSDKEKAQFLPKCAIGIHLRKEKNIVRLVAELNETIDELKENAGGVFLAYDPFSFEAAEKIETIVKERGLALITVDKFEDHVTRATVNGLLDAVVDHTLLSSCDYLLPFQIERSTYHDTALGRVVWRHHLDKDAIRRVIGRPDTTHNSPPDTRLPPPLADCYFPTYLPEDQADTSSSSSSIPATI